MDGDLDGYGTSAAVVLACDRPAGTSDLSTDCADANASINPSAAEICDAADTDEDCDGLTDDADPSATGKTSWSLDADTDGYGTTTLVSRCDASATATLTTGDCDDTNASINPGEAEDCATAAADDCSGSTNDLDAVGCTDWYTDVDNDGYGMGAAACRCAASGTYRATADADCDDADATRHPAAVDICRDGIDQDCSGADATCRNTYPIGDIAADAITTRVEGTCYSGAFGGRGLVASDLNGDGYDDLLVSNVAYFNGIVWRFDGPFEGSTLGSSGGASAYYMGAATGDGAYVMNVVGDQDGDGVQDFAIGAAGWDDVYTDGGGVFIIPGDETGAYSLSSSYPTFYGEGTGYGFGTAIAPAGDINDDGYDDVAAATYTSGTTQVGFYLGPLSTSSSAIATISSDSAGDYLGTGLDGGGHINSDVYDDAILGAPYASSGGSGAGEVYVIAGRSAPISYTAGTSAFANYWGSASENLGYSVSVVNDWDGDGMDDVLMGAPGYSSSSGRAWLVTAPTSGSAGSVATYADASFTSASSGVTFGTAVDGDGDLDNDGYDDWLAGSSLSDRSFADAGTSYVVYGPVSGVDGPLMWHGPLSSSYAGAVAGAGDTNNDGYDDYIVGGLGRSKLWVFEGP